GASILDSLFKNWNRTPPVEAKAVEMAEYFWYFDSSKAEEELNFTPRDAQETLQDTIAYLRENFLGEGVFK
ncbi:MAG: NAD-dependent epimerase, partial [Acidobacteria bacterium]|nr:NAD-dependent epimerase [Acidobacteriota bacterium]